jgi:hypothetical protein
VFAICNFRVIEIKKRQKFLFEHRFRKWFFEEMDSILDFFFAKKKSKIESISSKNHFLNLSTKIRKPLSVQYK